jgi:hypothetical protein
MIICSIFGSKGGAEAGAGGDEDGCTEVRSRRHGLLEVQTIL